MRVILNFAAAQPFVKVRDVIALDPPLSTACQNTSRRQLVEQSARAARVPRLRSRQTANLHLCNRIKFLDFCCGFKFEKNAVRVLWPARESATLACMVSFFVAPHVCLCAKHTQ